MSRKLPKKYLTDSSGTRDFFVLGSKSGFGLMVSSWAALAIIAVIAIILFIRKTFFKEIIK